MLSHRMQDGNSNLGQKQSDIVGILQEELRAHLDALTTQVRAIVSQELETSTARWDGLLCSHLFGPLAKPWETHTLGVPRHESESDVSSENSGQREAASQATSKPCWAHASEGSSRPRDLKVSEPTRRCSSATLDPKGCSTTADLRHSLLHSIAELDANTGSPLNRRLRKSVTALMVTLPPPLHRRSTWLSTSEEPRSGLQRVRVHCQKRIVETNLFESVVIFMICFNTVMIGVSCDWNLTHLNEPEPTAFQVLERCFAAVFALELVLRIFAYGWQFFWRSDPGQRLA